MITHKTQLLHTRRGNVIRLSREHYLRDDINCQLPGFCTNPFTNSDAKFVLVLDTDTILNQIDALHDDNFVNALFLQTVYDSVKMKSRAVINRLDRLIRTPEKHFSVFANEHFKLTYVEQQPGMPTQEHHKLLIMKALDYLSKGTLKVLFLTNTERDAEEMNEIAGDSKKFSIMSIHKWAENDESLAARLTAEDSNNVNEILYEDHLSILEVQKLVDEGKAFVGTFSLSQFSREEGTVKTKKNEIIIQSKINQNRAIDGDMVAVQLLPEEEYLVVGETKFPTGKVISIIKPATRIICGTIQEPPNITNDWQNVLVVTMD